MAEYVMDDGSTVKTETSVRSWRDHEEDPLSAGFLSIQTLRMAQDGRYYVELTSRLTPEDILPCARWVTAEEAAEEAADWLRRHRHQPPDELSRRVDVGS